MKINWSDISVEVVSAVLIIIGVGLMGFALRNTFPDQLCIEGVVHEKFPDEDFTRPTSSKCVIKKEE